MSKELLFSVTKKDFEFDYFRTGGPGGQSQNKTESGVRVRHVASGAVGESREERDQGRNKKTAFNRCVNSKKFQIWIRMKAAELMMEESVDQKIERLMDEKNIKTEVKNQKGQWTQVDLPLEGEN